MARADGPGWQYRGDHIRIRSAGAPGDTGIEPEWADEAFADDDALAGCSSAARMVIVVIYLRTRLRTYPDLLSYYRQVGLASTGAQLGVAGWEADYLAGSAFFGPLFSCTSYQPRQPYNTNPAGFCDRQIDSQIARATALQTANAAVANRAWQRIDREIMQQAPWIPLVNPLGIDLVSERVGNYQRTPALGVLLDQLWIKN